MFGLACIATISSTGWALFVGITAFGFLTWPVAALLLGSKESRLDHLAAQSAEDPKVEEDPPSGLTTSGLPSFWIASRTDVGPTSSDETRGHHE
jgi:hypothetical protein